MASPYTRRMKQCACQTKQLPVITLHSYLKWNTGKIKSNDHVDTVELASESPGRKKISEGMMLPELSNIYSRMFWETEKFSPSFK